MTTVRFYLNGVRVVTWQSATHVPVHETTVTLVIRGERKTFHVAAVNSVGPHTVAVLLGEQPGLWVEP